MHNRNRTVVSEVVYENVSGIVHEIVHEIVSENCVRYDNLEAGSMGVILTFHKRNHSV